MRSTSDHELSAISREEAMRLIDAGWKLGELTDPYWGLEPFVYQGNALGENWKPVHANDYSELLKHVDAVAASRPKPSPITTLTPASNAIHSFTWDPDTCTMEIRYKSNPHVVYIRHNVDRALFDQAMAAESIGRFITSTFNKGSLDRYPETRRVEGEEARSA